MGTCAVQAFQGFLLRYLLAGAAAAHAQEPEPDTRQDVIERGQADKVDTLHPYVENRAERIFDRIHQRLVNRQITWYPFLQNAYSGGGMAFGGYMRHVSRSATSMSAAATAL